MIPNSESLTVEFKSDRKRLPDTELVEALVCRLHFVIVLDKIVACYTNESSRALIMTSEGEGDSPQLGMIGVNLNDTQTEMMMDTLCAFRTNERQATQGALN